MDTFERLAEAKTELAFFIILCDLFNNNHRRNVEAELHSRWSEQYGFFVDVPISQMVTDIDERTHRTITERVVTSTFTFREDGTLIWKIRNQPPIIGLKPIQAELRRLREALQVETLPKGTTI